MTRRLAFVLAAAALLSGCSAMSGPNDLFGYALPQPGVLASAPDLATASITPAPAARPLAVQPLAPLPAASQTPSRAPVLPGDTASIPAPLASSAEEEKRERMIASALAPASSYQNLGELNRNADGTMVLPAPPEVEIIDIAPIRDSMATANDLPAGL
jgi:hypothetical protein